MEFEMQVSGLKGLMIAIEKAGDIPENVQKDMVDAKATVTADSLRYFAAKMLTGPYNEYGVARSVTQKKPKMRKSGAYEEIIFKGTQHGNRLGEIAFINQYGKKKQKARPFITEAIKDAKDPGSTAALKVLDEYLSSIGL